MEKSVTYTAELREKIDLIKEHFELYLESSDLPELAIDNSEYLPELRRDLIDSLKLVEDLIETIDVEHKKLREWIKRLDDEKKS